MLARCCRPGFPSLQRVSLRALTRMIAVAFAGMLAAAAQPLSAQPLSAQPTYAQPAPFRCAFVLPSATRQPPYARVPGREQCEGYFEQTVSQPFIELLSLTRHRPDAPPAAKLLQIRATAATALQLTIQPLRPSPFYRVDARLAPGNALAWNAAPMLASTGLRLSDLGFLARAPSADPATPLVAPLSLSSLPLAGGNDAVLAYAVLRVSVPVASIAARQYRPGAVGSWRELPGTPLFEWDTIILPIVLPDAPAGAGAGPGLRVDVRATGADGSLLPMMQFAVAGR